MDEKNNVSSPIPITVSYGDGIGPEIMGAVLRVLDAAEAPLDYEPIEIGEKVYLRGATSGMEKEAWDSIRRTRVFLKAPITTPQGGGYKSLNVTIRKSLGLFANIRPCVSYHPIIPTKHPKMDVVVVRENEEDLYAGIEHRQTDEVYQCLKLVSRPGTERIVRYAFEYARMHNRKRVSAFTKDNIMKLTDGIFHRVFDQIAEEYPDIEADHYILDIGTARLADTPERFDVIVTPNLYGDVISDIAAQISGSVGLGGSANVGLEASMFEAIHGSAPDIAGKDIANPSGLLLAAVNMLVYLGKGDIASSIHNAWLRTLEDGIATPDIYQVNSSRKKVGTQEFADEVIHRLGQEPKVLDKVHYTGGSPREFLERLRRTTKGQQQKRLIGSDIFVCCEDRDPNKLAVRLRKAETHGLRLVMITNRGVKVWPNGFPETFCTDHWRCRFAIENETQETLSPEALVALQGRCLEENLEVIKTENLYYFDDVPGFSLGQGQ